MVEFSVGAEFFCPDARFSGTYHSTLTHTLCGNTNGTADAPGHAPNAWGLDDTHGNAWEWCLDSFARFNAAPVTDPFMNGGLNRRMRGGSWNQVSFVCRSAARASNDPNFTEFNIGFRVVLAPVLVP